MPTAFLTASTFEVLPFLGTPGAATVGHALVWSESPKGFTLSPISVGPDQFSGILPVGKGGTGTSNGSITGTGALTFAAGGTNQDINLNPSGTGRVIIPNRLQFALASNTSNLTAGFEIAKQGGFLQISNGVSPGDQFVPVIFGRSVNTDRPGLIFGALPFRDSVAPAEGVLVFATYNTSYGAHPSNWRAIAFENGSIPLLSIFGGGDSIFHSTTESTSTSTGAVRINGGIGVAKNVNIGGNLRFAGGTVPATATSAGTTGDIRYDGSHLYICTATNTWVRTALSTW